MRNLKIADAEGTWVVRTGGAVIGESARTVEVVGEDGEATMYFPRGDLGMEFLDVSESAAAADGVGERRFFNVVDESGVIRDAAWSYEAPAEGAERLAGLIAFDTSRLAIEEV